MQVKIRILEREIVVEVGDGRQSVRWLAQTVQARIAVKKLMRLEFAEDKVIVTAIRNASGAIINPYMEIAEAVPDLSIPLKADVSDATPTDEYGNPVLTQWTQDAYVKSAAGKNFFQGNKGWKRNPSRMRTPGTRGRSGAGGLLSADGLVFVGNMSDSDVLTAFELDWPQIDWGFALQEVSNEDMERLKDGVMRCYDVICRLFQHYAGLGQAGQRYGITLNDFARMLHCAGLSNYAAGMKRLEMIFSKSVDGGLPGDKEATANTNTSTAAAAASSAVLRPGGVAPPAQLPPGQWAVMSRPEFVQAVARVALLGERQDSIREGGVELILRNFSRLVPGPLLRYWTDLERTREIYKDDAARDLFSQAHRLLQTVFQGNSTVDPRLGPTMSFSSFENVIKSTGLFIDRLSFIKKLEDIFYFDCRASIPRADVAPVKGLTDAGVFGSPVAGAAAASQGLRSKSQQAEARSSEREFEDVTFSEFCEAIMRAFPMALAKNDDFSDDLDRKRTGLRKLAGAVVPVSSSTGTSDSSAVAEAKPTTSAGDRAAAKSSQGRK